MDLSPSDPLEHVCLACLLHNAVPPSETSLFFFSSRLRTHTTAFFSLSLTSFFFCFLSFLTRVPTYPCPEFRKCFPRFGGVRLSKKFLGDLGRFGACGAPQKVAAKVSRFGRGRAPRFCSQSTCNRLRSHWPLFIASVASLQEAPSESTSAHTPSRGVTGGHPCMPTPERQKEFLASGDSFGGARARTCLGCVLWGEGGGGLLYVATLRAFTYRRVVSHAVSVRFLSARISVFDFWRTICPQINFAHKFREIWADKNEITQQNLGACGAQFCGQG